MFFFHEKSIKSLDFHIDKVIKRQIAGKRDNNFGKNPIRNLDGRGWWWGATGSKNDEKCIK